MERRQPRPEEKTVEEKHTVLTNSTENATKSNDTPQPAHEVHSKRASSDQLGIADQIIPVMLRCMDLMARKI